MPLLLLLGGCAVFLLAILLFSTWRGVREESLPNPAPSVTPSAQSTPHSASTQQAFSSNEETTQPISSPTSSVIEGSPAQAETPEPIPYNPTTSVPAVFGATGNVILTNIPYAPGLEDIANDFIEKVKQGGWDTTSEAYKKNWEKAVEEADNTVRARYGTEVYLRLKQEAAP